MANVNFSYGLFTFGLKDGSNVSASEQILDFAHVMNLDWNHLPFDILTINPYTVEGNTYTRIAAIDAQEEYELCQIVLTNFDTNIEIISNDRYALGFFTKNNDKYFGALYDLVQVRDKTMFINSGSSSGSLALFFMMLANSMSEKIPEQKSIFIPNGNAKEFGLWLASNNYFSVSSRVTNFNENLVSNVRPLIFSDYIENSVLEYYDKIEFMSAGIEPFFRKVTSNITTAPSHITNITFGIREDGYRVFNILLDKLSTQSRDNFLYSRNDNEWFVGAVFIPSNNQQMLIPENAGNKLIIRTATESNIENDTETNLFGNKYEIEITNISPQLKYVVNEKEGTIDVTCLGGLTIGLNKMTGAGWALVEQKDLNERNYCSFNIRESGKYQLFTIKTKPAYLSETSEDIDVDISLDTPIVSLVLGEVSYYGRDYDNNNIIKTFENQLKITEVKNAMGYRIYKDGELYDIIVNDNNISSAFANVIYKKINKK